MVIVDRVSVRPGYQHLVAVAIHSRCIARGWDTVDIYMQLEISPAGLFKM